MEISDEPNRRAHGSAIAKRVMSLASLRPDIYIQSDLEGDGDTYADLICWEFEPGKAWVWQFQHHREFEANAMGLLVSNLLERVSRHPLSQGLSVLPGPSFAELGMPDEDTVASMGDTYKAVAVFDSGQPGLQLYRLSPQDPHDPSGREYVAAIREAVDIASDCNQRVKKVTATGPES